MAIIVTRNGRDAERVEEKEFEYEDKMQEYINKNPLIIPVNDIKENLKLMIITREFPVSSGSVDHLAVDNEGNIYIIETKLFKNPDKRKIIGQIMDYGSSIWSDSSQKPEWFNEKVERFCSENSRKTFKEKIMEEFELPENEFEGYQKTITDNLSYGNFRFVIVMNKLDESLKNLIRFVNKKTNFAIYAVELEYYKHNEFEIVIPKMFGPEIEKEIKAASFGRMWDEQKFFEDAKEKGMNEMQLEALRKLYDFSKENANGIFWGSGKTGSANVKFFNISRSLYSLWSNGELSINIGWFKSNERTKELMNEFLKELEKIKELEIPKESQNLNVVNIPIDKWYSSADKFINTVQNLIRK